jgi:hypothetical protein
MNILFYMKESLEELKFNYDTVLYLKQLGWGQNKIMEYFVNKLNYPSGAVSALLTLKQSYLNSVLKRLDLYLDLKLSNDEVKLHMSKYSNLVPLVNLLLDTSAVEEVLDEATEGDNITNTGDVEVDNVKEVKVVEEDGEEEEEDEETNELDMVEEDEEDESNVFEKFLEENVEQTENEGDKIKSSVVYSKFKKWFSSNYEEETPSKTELKSFLNDKLGKSVKSVWTGASLK